MVGLFIMSRFLIGVSGMAFMVCLLLQGLNFLPEVSVPLTSVWMIVFAVLSIPFVMLVLAIFFIVLGAVLISPFVGLNYLDQAFEIEDEE